MRTLLIAAAMTAAATAAFADTDNFDKDQAGSRPADWSCGVTGGGSPRWMIEADASAPSQPNVLEQSDSGKFPWCVKKGVSIADGSVEVKFRPLKGEEDQAGGLVWRWKDGDNYYVARANALENNVSLYRTTNGRRITIKYVDAPVATNRWHVLRVEFAGQDIKVLLDDKPYIELSHKNISGPGAVGVWTKADSVTEFDDYSFEAR